MDKQGIALYKLAVLRKKYQRSLLLRVITYMSPKYLKSVGKIKKTYFFSPKPGFRQSWTKVLGNLLQYAYFSVISPFPLKTVHFRNFLALPPPPTLYKVETRKKFWIHSSNINCWWGEGRGWTCVNWKKPQKCKSVSRLLSMIVDCKRVVNTIHFHVSQKHNFQTAPCLFRTS